MDCSVFLTQLPYDRLPITVIITFSPGRDYHWYYGCNYDQSSSF